MQRRTFIIAGVAGAAGLVEYTFLSQYMNGIRNPQGISVKAYERFGPKAALMAITANASFYVTSKGGTPRVDAGSWQLQFDGLVSHPFSLSYKELLSLPKFERTMTLECISDPIGGNAIGNARWTGTALKPLIERAQPTAEATHAVIYAADGFSSGHPLERLWNEENFLSYQMNGQDLPPVHGYPVRIFIPGKFGMKQPKWVKRISFVKKPVLGYWESQGWSDTCERWAHARFTDLQNGATLSGAKLELAGFAIGNLDGIKSVEISFDNGGSWRSADIFSNPSPMVWAFWKYTWVSPAKGNYKIRVRAIDGKGRVEGPDPKGIFPNGATGQQMLEIKVT
jgi:DMSO/TMAO reductase YedYZ molybdopterin-dependent catalytic subunit